MKAGTELPDGTPSAAAQTEEGGEKKHKARPGPVRLHTDWFELDGRVENKMKEKRWMRRPVGEVTAREGVMEGVWMEGWRTMGGCRVS